MTAPAFTAKRAAVCRMVGVDFESREITLRALASSFPYIVNGNYVVIPQEDFIEIKERAARDAKARGEQ